MLLCLFLCFGCASLGLSAPAKVIKVLPQFLDLQERTSISPSLYDRDAYQAKLRREPKERSGLRFNVQWRSRDVPQLKLRVEMRGGNKQQTTRAVLETSAQHLSGLSRWTPLTLSGEEYKKFGELVAWRVTLWDGEKLVSEKQSFLW
jgi:hypothetical protein